MIQTLKELSEADFAYRAEKYPEFAKTNAAFYKKYSDKTANKLTAAIKRWFELSGGMASRTNVQGQYDPRTKKFRHSGSTKGQADLNCVYGGRSIQVEVKIGKDRQNLDQKLFKERVENSGGIYILAKSWEDFIQQMSRVV
jgi:hypothetical protein